MKTRHLFILVVSALSLCALIACGKDKRVQAQSEPALGVQTQPEDQPSPNPIPAPEPVPPPITEPSPIAVAAWKLIKPNGEKVDASARPIPVCSKLEVTLSAAVDPATFGQSFTLVQGTAAVAGSVAANSDRTVMTFSPTACFAFKSTYTVRALGTEASFVTMTPGDITGDGIPDVVATAPMASPSIYEAYVFSGASLTGSVTIANAASTIRLPHDPPTSAGTMIASIPGDVNGDGYADVIISTFSADTLRGRAFFFSGKLLSSSANVNAANAVAFIGGSAGDQYGSSVTGIGDVNHDGFADVAVGAPERGASRGVVYIYSGAMIASKTVANQVLTTDALIALSGSAAGEKFGTAIANAGDVNGDGAADIVIGAPLYKLAAAAPITGAAFVHSGAAFFAQPAQAGRIVTVRGEAAEDLFGQSVAGLGDITQTGHSGIIVGAPGYGLMEQGAAYIFAGEDLISNPTLLTTDAVFTVEGTAVVPGIASGDRYVGWPVVALGDVTGDGLPDAAFTVNSHAPAFLAPAPDYHGVMRLIRSANVRAGAARSAFIATGRGANDFYGASAAAIGDVNGDGITEVVISAPGANSSGAGATAIAPGAVYVYDGSSFASGRPTTLSTIEYPHDRNGMLGFSVAGAGPPL